MGAEGNMLRNSVCFRHKAYVGKCCGQLETIFIAFAELLQIPQKL